MIIPELCGKADALLIVPPFAMTNYQSLAAHILQGVGKRAGFSVRVFYANIHLASCLGDLYPQLCVAGPYLMGERSFAKAAWGLETEQLYHRNLYDHKNSFGWEREGQVFYPPAENIPLEKLRHAEEVIGLWVESLRDSFKSLDCPLVGLTCTYEQINASFALMRTLKEARPETVTFLGGFSAEGEMAQGLASLDPDSSILDYIFSGEGEGSFVRFLEGFYNGQRPNERITIGAPMEDLDALPIPEYGEYFSQLERYLPAGGGEKDILLAMESSRGCWWGEKSHCLFCGNPDNRLRYRQKSSLRFQEELKRGEQYGVTYAHMADLIMPESYFETLLPALVEGNSPWTFYYEQRAVWDRDRLELLAASGVRDNQPGIETLSTDLLGVMKKGSSRKRNLSFLREATGAELTLYWNIIWGVPGESIEEYQDMISLIPLIAHLFPPMGVFRLFLYRFSPLFQNPEEWGLSRIRPLPAYREVFPPWTNTESLGYYFLCDYKAETGDHPRIIDEFLSLVGRWHTGWRDPLTRPRLHVARSGTGEILLLDTRNLGHPVQESLSLEEAAVLHENSPYEKTFLQEWALGRQAALVTGGEFVPLATMEYSLKKELEDDRQYK